MSKPKKWELIKFKTGSTPQNRWQNNVNDFEGNTPQNRCQNNVNFSATDFDDMPQPFSRNGGRNKYKRPVDYSEKLEDGRERRIVYIHTLLQYVEGLEDEDQQPPVEPATFFKEQPWLQKHVMVKPNKLEEWFNKANAKPLNSSKAESMMQKMGWSGGALGKTGSGIVEPIKPVMTYALYNKGLGVNEGVEKPVVKKKRGPSLEQLQRRRMKQNSKAYFKLNVLKTILDFVRNENEVEILFDCRLSNVHRKQIHQLMEALREVEGLSDAKLQEQSLAFLDLVYKITRFNRYVLYTQSEGVNPNRYLCLFKKAPPFMYLVTHLDLRDQKPIVPIPFKLKEKKTKAYDAPDYKNMNMYLPKFRREVTTPEIDETVLWLFEDCPKRGKAELSEGVKEKEDVNKDVSETDGRPGIVKKETEEATAGPSKNLDTGIRNENNETVIIGKECNENSLESIKSEHNENSNNVTKAKECDEDSVKAENNKICNNTVGNENDENCQNYDYNNHDNHDVYYNDIDCGQSNYDDRNNYGNSNDGQCINTGYNDGHCRNRKYNTNNHGNYNERNNYKNDGNYYDGNCGQSNYSDYNNCENYNDGNYRNSYYNERTNFNSYGNCSDTNNCRNYENYNDRNNCNTDGYYNDRNNYNNDGYCDDRNNYSNDGMYYNDRSNCINFENDDEDYVVEDCEYEMNSYDPETNQQMEEYTCMDHKTYLRNKIVSYFADFVTQPKYTELKFLGNFNTEEFDVVDDFTKQIWVFLHGSPIADTDLCNILRNADCRFSLQEDCNGGTSIMKIVQKEESIEEDECIF